MDYNSILNNKRKFKEIKNKTIDMLNKATETITGVTATAVDTVVDTVKNIGNQTAKVGIFEDVISVIDSELINSTLENKNATLSIVEYKLEQDGVISIEGILEGVTATYEENLKIALTSSDYIEALFSLVAAHYNHESGVKYSLDKRVITISIIPAEENVVAETKADVVNETVVEERVKEEAVVEDISEKEEEFVCDCKEKCETCACKESLTLEEKSE